MATNPQPTFTDYSAQTAERLDLSSHSVGLVPQLTLASGVLVGVSIVNGVVVYNFQMLMTGSAMSAPLTVPKTHRFVRLEAVQYVNGVPDATGLLLNFKRLNPQVSGGGVQTTLFSNSNNQAVDSVVFVGGVGWESDQTTYIINPTGQSGDYLLLNLYLQYI